MAKCSVCRCDTCRGWTNGTPFCWDGVSPVVPYNWDERVILAAISWWATFCFWAEAVRSEYDAQSGVYVHRLHTCRILWAGSGRRFALYLLSHYVVQPSTSNNLPFFSRVAGMSCLRLVSHVFCACGSLVRSYRCWLRADGGSAKLRLCTFRAPNLLLTVSMLCLCWSC